MAITRSQQARQMLKKGTSKPVVQGGVDNYLGKQPQVVAPRKWQSGPDKPPTELAYITEAEKKLLLKEDIHGSLKKGPNVGPSGIMSLDSFGDADGSGMAGGDVSRAEAGDFGPIGGGGGDGPKLPPGVTRKPTKTEQDLRSAFIAAGGGKRVNPGFFDSRNTVSPQELALAKAFAPSAFAKSRRGGFLDFITGGGITGALIRGLGQKFFGLGKKFNEPTYDMRGLNTRVYEAIPGVSTNPNNLDIYNEFVDDEDNTTIPRISESDMSIPIIPRINLNDYEGVTPFQKDVIQDTEDLSNDPFLKNAMADKSTANEELLKNLLNPKLNVDEFIDQEDEKQKRQQELLEEILRQQVADGGVIGGGIMDAAGRQNYFLGKLVKKAKRAVKKIVKSPLGKLGIGAALAFTPFGGKTLASRFMGLSDPMKYLIGGVGLSSLPLIFGKEEEQQPTGFTGSVGGQIPQAAYTDPRSVMFRAFRMADGGSIKEPVAKKTMPLLDMGGQEMDLRAEGGFVPIGRMEKADDVPARLSKNEFVFTADAVRNAGDGNVDKGAEVMYNMMKNLEAGGNVSEESQGLEGARNMFQTAKRLEDVV